MHDARVEVSAEIGQPRETVFEFLVTPQKIPLVLPGLVENVEIPPLPLTEGSRFRYRYQMYGVMLEGYWKCLEINRPGRYVAETDGDVPSHWTYTLDDAGNGRTRVSLVVTYETPRNVAAKIKSDVMMKINQKEAEAFFANLKTVLEMGEV